MQHVVQRHDFLRCMAAVARLGTQTVHPADHALVELRMRAHRIEHLGAILEQSRQDFVDVGDGKGVVGAKIASRALRAGASAVPGLARRIAIAHEQNVFALWTAGHQHRHRFGLGEAGQVEEIAVRPVGVLDVVVAQPDRRSRHDRRSNRGP